MVMCVMIGSALPSVDWTDSAESGSTSSPHTFSSQSIGAAHSTRQVFVATYIGNASAVTIGGISATQVASAASGLLKLWRAAVPTGTTASVVVTYSGGGGRLMITVWSAYNLRSTAAHDTASYDSSGSATSHTTTINTANKGIVIAAAASSVADGVRVSSWTGATLRDNGVLDDGSTDYVLSAATSEDTALATGATLRSTWSASVNANMVAATFR